MKVNKKKLSVSTLKELEFYETKVPCGQKW